MLLNRNGLINSNFCKEKLTVKKIEHQPTWLSYYQNYMDTLYYIVDKCSRNNNDFNCRSHAILFTFRHMQELCLKYNRDKKGLDPIISHVYHKLYADELNVPDMFKTICDKIDWNNHEEDGTCYRYYYKKTREPYFAERETIDFGCIISDFNQIASNGFNIIGRFPNINFSKRKIKDYMTLRLYECRGLGHIRTDYDSLFELILNGVLNNEISVNKVYLPLLFYIRHSLELAFKDNLSKVDPLIPSNRKRKKASEEHSLQKLFQIYSECLESIDISSLEPSLISQYNVKLEELKNFSDFIDKLDSNSRVFRFPFDESNHPISLPEDIDIYEITKTFYDIDSFITFYVDFLRDNGLLVEEPGL